MQKLKSILLIDDNYHDNFFHKLVLKELNCAEEVLTIQTPEEALSYLLSRNDSSKPLPDLIFVDLSMPKMDGFELLEACKRQKTIDLKETTVVMLSNSINPLDKERVADFEEVKLFANKPLSKKLMDEIFAQKIDN